MSEPTGTRRLPIVLDSSADLQQLRSTEVLQVPSIVSGATGTNIPIVITPTGTGAFQVSAGGDTRGDYALDLQSRRLEDTQVASGFGSSLLGCLNSTASNTGAFVAGGAGNIASGANSIIIGGANNANAGNQSAIVGGSHISVTSAAYNALVACGQYVTMRHRYAFTQGTHGILDETGRAQRQVSSLICVTAANGVPEELYLDGDGGSNTLGLAYGDVWYYTIKILGVKEDSEINSYSEKIEGIITRTAGGTQHVAGPTVIRTFGASLGTIVVSDPNHYLSINVTPNTDDSIFWLAFVDMIWINGYTA